MWLERKMVAEHVCLGPQKKNYNISISNFKMFGKRGEAIANQQPLMINLLLVNDNLCQKVLIVIKTLDIKKYV